MTTVVASFSLSRAGCPCSQMDNFGRADGLRDLVATKARTVAQRKLRGL